MHALRWWEGVEKQHSFFGTMVTSSMLLRIDATSTARGFEPLRAEPNGFLVHHLNHSVTLSCHILLASYACRLKFIAGLVSFCCKEFVGSSKILQKQASALRLSWVHSSVVRAADCRSAGPWFKSGCALSSARARNKDADLHSCKCSAMGCLSVSQARHR